MLAAVVRGGKRTQAACHGTSGSGPPHDVPGELTRALHRIWLSSHGHTSVSGKQGGLGLTSSAAGSLPAGLGVFGIAGHSARSHTRILPIHGTTPLQGLRHMIARSLDSPSAKSHAGVASAETLLSKLSAWTASLQCTAAGRRAILYGTPLVLTTATLTGSQARCFSGKSVALQHPHATDQRKHQKPAAKSKLSMVTMEARTVLRAAYLWALFLPAILLAPVCVQLGFWRDDWMRLVCWTLEQAGPAFIKWGQWAATRPDMFPPDLCHVLERLQSNAPTHSTKFSIAAVESAFLGKLGDIFEHFDEKPIASGSIAQIHRARLSPAAAAQTSLRPGTLVAVKVRHPGVDLTMQMDFRIMEVVAGAMSWVPALSDLRLEESIRQFGAPLKDQLDLSREASNLTRFNHNFRGWTNLSFPQPAYPLVSPSVLVESFEEGELISALVKAPDGLNSVAVAVTGMKSYLQMLLKDNFVHADLHPGNILVQAPEEAPEGSGLWANWRTALESLLGITPMSRMPHVVLLDVGMVAEMTNLDKLAMVDFFQSIRSLDGAAVAESIMKFSEETLSPAAAKGFVSAMEEVFEELDEAKMREFTQKVIADMMEAVRQHGVALRGTVSTLMVTTMVLEGWSTKLHPDIRILDSVKEILPGNWNDRISHAVDYVMSGGDIATQ